MKLFGHASGGYLASRLVTKSMDLSDSEKKRLLILGAAAGTLPDWDYFWYAYQKRGFKYNNDFRHHTWITHTFPFYWLIAGLFYAFGLFKKDKKIKNSSIVLGAATTTHLLQDMLGTGDGIMLYYPFSKKMTGIGLFNLHGDEWERAYIKSPYYLVELAFGAFAIITVLRDTFKKRSDGNLRM
jgi:hypothetical protein